MKKMLLAIAIGTLVITGTLYPHGRDSIYNIIWFYIWFHNITLLLVALSPTNEKRDKICADALKRHDKHFILYRIDNALDVGVVISLVSIGWFWGAGLYAMAVVGGHNMVHKDAKEK